MRSLAYGSLLLGLLACSSEPTPDAGQADLGTPKDATIDLGTPDSGPQDIGTQDIGTQDIGFQDLGTPDGGPIEGSLVGTSLEGLSVQFSEPLQLCDHWAEDGDLDAAIARKVHITLWPSERAGLEPAQLQSATLSQAMIRRGAYRAQHQTSMSASGLLEWELTGPSDAARLSARIHHVLSQGAIIEVLNVQRNAGDTTPLSYTGRAFGEAYFIYVRPDNTEVLLEACAGDDLLEEAVKVLVGFSGQRSVTIERVERTALALAGSAPLYPVSANISFSDQGFFDPVSVYSFWAQTYAAGHHNWSEHSLIEPSKEPKWHQLVFGPISRGEAVSYPPTIVETAELINVNTPATQGTVRVTELDVPSGQKTETDFAVEVDWKRVDDTDLLRQLQANGCPNGQVTALELYHQDGNYLFQTGRCGGEIVLLVPVRFPADPMFVGQRIDGLTPIMGGVEATLGNLRVQVPNSTNANLRVLNGASVVVEGFPFERSLIDESAVYEERIEAEASGVSMTLVRRLIAQGVGNSGIYTPIVFELSFDDEVHRVEALDAMNYSNTHHNWDDALIAESDTLKIFWSVSEFGQTAMVRAEDLQTGEEVLPPTTVTRR